MENTENVKYIEDKEVDLDYFDKINDPVIIAIWNEFGRGNLNFIEFDDERYFGKKFEDCLYKFNRTDDDVTLTRPVRMIVMDYMEFDLKSIHYFMSSWMLKSSGKSANRLLVSFLESQRVLDLFGRGVLSFFGVSITRSGSNIEVEKIDLEKIKLSIADGWEFFAQLDKFLVMKNSTPDKKLKKIPQFNSDILPFEKPHHTIEEIGELFLSLISEELRAKFQNLADKYSSELADLNSNL